MLPSNNGTVHAASLIIGPYVQIETAIHIFRKSSFRVCALCLFSAPSTSSSPPPRERKRDIINNCQPIKRMSQCSVFCLAPQTTHDHFYYSISKRTSIQFFFSPVSPTEQVLDFFFCCWSLCLSRKIGFNLVNVQSMGTLVCLPGQCLIRSSRNLTKNEWKI